MPTNYATKQAASKLQVSPNTLRNWSEQYADSLSESARPGHQPERQFTDIDMTVLQYIKQLRGEGMKEDGIKQRLSETTFTNTEILQPPTISLQADTSIASVATQEAPHSTPAPIVGQSTDHAILARLVRLETVIEQGYENQRDSTQAFALGFIAALLFVLVIVGIAVLYGGFR